MWQYTNDRARGQRARLRVSTAWLLAIVVVLLLADPAMWQQLVAQAVVPLLVARGAELYGQLRARDPGPDLPPEPPSLPEPEPEPDEQLDLFMREPEDARHDRAA